VSDEPTAAELYSALRPLLFSIAYRMLGSVSAAEDVVQESFLRYHPAQQDGVAIEAPKAYLTTIATRLSVDALRRAKRQRETYVGTWLPEPLLTDPSPDAAEQVETADTLSLAFLVLLESLSPVERAVFLLREVSITATRRSPTSWIARPITAGRLPCGRGAVSTRVVLATNRRQPNETSSQSGSSRRASTAICKHYRDYWLQT
jgi:RNA polymerase sigma factor (sigma-70 family)